MTYPSFRTKFVVKFGKLDESSSMWKILLFGFEHESAVIVGMIRHRNTQCAVIKKKELWF